jgi:hypothetical protein
LDVEAGRLKIGDHELFSYLFAPKSQPAIVTASSSIEMPPESSVITNDGSAWKIARERYNDASTFYVFPDGNRIAGNRIQDWSQIPSGTRVILNEAEASEIFEGFYEIGRDGETPKSIAGFATDNATTIYFFPDGLVSTGAKLKARKSWRKLLKNPPQGTRLLIGYVYGGSVKGRRSPSAIAGDKWNYPSTYYRTPDGEILSGDDIDVGTIPSGTLIFYQR